MTAGTPSLPPEEPALGPVLDLTPGNVAAENAPLVKPAPEKAAPEKQGELTPFMRQWSAAKRENPDALLFFRMGDFYELFYDDAVVASRELQLTLTARDREKQVPMCGVPYHAVEGYLARLLRKGYRIAICDQMEDPKLTKKIVRREVTRVLSPGTALDAELGQEQNNFLAAYIEGPSSGRDKRSSGAKAPHENDTVSYGLKPVPSKELVCAIALLDVSTGEFRTAGVSWCIGAAASYGRDSAGRRRARCCWRRARRLRRRWSAWQHGRVSRTGCGRVTLLFRWWNGS